LDDFTSKLVGTLNNLNYLRYAKAFPSDNIKFIFMEKGDGTAVEGKPGEREQVVQKLMNF
jgi:hypothetical protein